MAKYKRLLVEKLFEKRIWRYERDMTWLAKVQSLIVG
jgi:hypothetical protein